MGNHKSNHYFWVTIKCLLTRCLKLRQMLEISQDLFPSSRGDINDSVHRFIRFHWRNKKAHCHLSLSTSPGFQSPLLTLNNTAPLKTIHTLHMQHGFNILFVASTVRIYMLSIYLLHIKHSLCSCPWLLLKIIVKMDVWSKKKTHLHFVFL